MDVRQAGSGSKIEIIQDTAVTTVMGPPSASAVGGSGTLPIAAPKGAGSRIEIMQTRMPNDEQAGNVTVFGGGNVNIRTTVSDEGANYEITAEDGTTRNIMVPATKSKSGSKMEKRIILEDGIETVEEYENGKLIRKTVNGRDQPLK